MSPTLAIIGAGLSGLQCARAMLSVGFEVTILDRQASVGGVWLKVGVSVLSLKVRQPLTCSVSPHAPPGLRRVRCSK